MYLAPLNYDRFFKKVFSETKIAKRFIEDFLDVKIEAIEPVLDKYKLTDAASAIEFDYRCKIDGKFIVVDMQQWYKPDVIKRFYLYHCVSSAVQLEMMPSKSIPAGEEKLREERDYRLLEPVITIVWLVDDTLGTNQDFLSYVLTPELLSQYIQKEELWHNHDFNQLLAERNELIKILNNKTKNTQFLAQNKLIFAFQRNIVKQTKLDPYVSWFKFAEKTRNENNTADDFEEYAQDEIFAEIIRRINTTSLESYDFVYIKDFKDYAEGFKRLQEGLKEEGREEGREEKSKELAISWHKKGKSIELISELLELPIATIARFVSES